jgi:hypothetical protein
MAIRDEDIRTWLSVNQGLSDKQIADAMKQYGVTPTQLANAVGANASDVQARYDKATAPSVYDWFNANKGASSADLANAMKQYGFSTGQVSQRMGIPVDLVEEMYNNHHSYLEKKNEVPVSSPTIIDQGVAQPPKVNPSVATTTAQNVLGGGVPQQPQIPPYARQPWMNNPIPPQYQQMTRQQMQPPSWYSQTPPWVQQMQSWGRQQPQQQPPMPPQYQQPQMCQAPQQIRYAQPTYGRY